MANEPFSDFVVDFRLLDASLEMKVLEAHLNLVEEQIQIERKSAKTKLDAEIKKLSVSLQESEPGDQDGWLGEIQLAEDEYRYHVGFVLPRALRSPFLVSLYSVYESTVTEIANLMQRKVGQKISLDDLRGNFLDRAKKYYEHILQFPLSQDKRAWERLVILSCLRNAVAHANGRLDMVDASTKRRIHKWKGQQIGVQNNRGYIVVSGAFLRGTFTLITSDLKDLVARYKVWDDDRRTPSIQQT